MKLFLEHLLPQRRTLGMLLSALLENPLKHNSGPIKTLVLLTELDAETKSVDLKTPLELSDVLLLELISPCLDINQ